MTISKLETTETTFRMVLAALPFVEVLVIDLDDVKLLISFFVLVNILTVVVNCLPLLFSEFMD